MKKKRGLWKVARADYHWCMPYDVIFRGRLASGFTEDVVCNNLTRLFRIDPQRAAALLRGKRVVLKKNLNKEQAEKYRSVLRKAGAVVAVVQQRDPNPSRSAPAADPGEPIASAKRASFQIDDPEADREESAPERASFRIDETPPEETPESDREDAGEPSAAEARAEDGLDYPGSEAPAKPAVQTEPVSIPPGDAADDLAPEEPPPLDEPGIQLVAAEPPPEPAIDTSTLSMSEVGVRVDDSPRPAAEEIDTSHLAAEDFDSLDEGERPPPPEIDLSGLSIADPGATVDESPRPPGKEIDTSSLSATDIDEPLDKTKKPDEPDIDLSGLDLEDD